MKIWTNKKLNFSTNQNFRINLTRPDQPVPDPNTIRNETEPTRFFRVEKIAIRHGTEASGSGRVSD
jgi:hypothetical protein